MDVNQAQGETRKLKQIFLFYPELPAIYSEWEKLVNKYLVMGKPAHDTRLVAAMLVHQINNLLTFNTDDFKRYLEITAIDPRNIQ